MTSRPTALRRGRHCVGLFAATLALSGAGVANAATPHADAAAATRTVKTLYGDVKVPVDAKRIAALDFPEATALADLGIKPVAIGNYIPDLPSYTSFFKGVPVATDTAGIPVLEKVAAAKPDVIILDMFATDVAKNRGIYEQLSQIAPTVVLKWTTAAGNWPADASGTAATVGKTAAMNRLRAGYLAHAASIKTKYAKTLASHPLDLVSGNASKWFLYSPSSSHGRVLAAAGARFAAAKSQKDGYVEYSTERYPLLRPSKLIMLESASVSAAKPVTSNPLFSALPVAEAGNVFETRYFFPSSYRVANALLDDFAGALARVK